MTRPRRNTIFAVAMLSALAFVLAGADAMAWQYFIAAPHSYSGGSCNGGANVGEYEHDLRTGLDGLGWSGHYYTDGWVRARAWVDPGRATLGWDNLDDVYNGFSGGADLADIAIFSGHGNTGKIFISAQDQYLGETLCSAGASGNDLSTSNILLSAGYGAKVASSVFIACCYMNVNYQSLILESHHEKQVMGFGSKAQLEGSMVTSYWNHTASTSNIDAWLNDMEDRPGWWSGDNTTVVMSRGNTEDERTWNQTYCGLKRQFCVDGTGGGYWALNWHDHGCGGCSGC